MAELFNPLTLRGITFRNRIFVSPMCQYSAVEGMPNDWHFVHLGSRAVGGAGLVMVEATAVSPEGRISPQDTGLWSDAHIEAYRRIAEFVRQRGAAPIPFGPNYPMPKALTEEQIKEIVNQFRASAVRAVRAGFDVVEIHMAHGYLVHEFLSPISNRREDRYGGDFENRTRFPLRVAEAVREEWPKRLPVFVRMSATDWVEGGWDIEESVRFSSLLRERGVDLIDCSSGGISPTIQIPIAPGYQVPFAERIRKEANIATGAVGLISEPQQAEQIIASGQADAVFLARAMLRDPYWALHAAQALSVEVRWPDQYLRAVN